MFKIYFGIVENNLDPYKMARVQARIIGIHTEKKDQSKDSGIPVEHLPWIWPVFPITSSSTTGIGTWSVPVHSSTIVCIPFDEELQRWGYIGTIPSFPREKANADIGFNDPGEKYPLEERLEEPDTNRLFRNDNIENTIINIKNQEQLTDIYVASLSIPGTDLSNFTTPTANNETIDEPEENYAAEYPDNIVFESNPKEFKSGHVIEIDDTEDKERIHIWHKTGTSISIRSAGEKIEKVINDNVTITLKNKIEYTNYHKIETISGNYRISISGNELKENYGYVKKYTKGNETKYISGNVGMWIGANIISTPEQPTFEILSKKLDESVEEIEPVVNEEISEIGGNFNLLIENTEHKKIKGNRHETVDGAMYIKISGTRNTIKNKVGDSGDCTIEPYGEFMVKGHKKVRLKGNHIIPDEGCINGFSFCPYMMMPHSFKSRTVKSTI